MTNLFISVFKKFAQSNNWYFKHYNGILSEFMIDLNTLEGNKILSVNNNNPDFASFPKNYVGSHIIRDPRDLLVSGYRYHKWCKEPWVLEKMDGDFLSSIEADELISELSLKDKSYQDLLNAIDTEKGLILELNWRQLHFKEMELWDYNNPKILELKYEDVFNNEAFWFEQLFKFYGLNSKLISKAKKVSNEVSFKNREKSGNTGEQKHLSIGSSEQWKTFLPESVKQEFKRRYNPLLIKLGYENDEKWS